jgi:hypothetical protein
MTPKAKRKGFTLREFVTSCSTCMGKEGLLNEVKKTEASASGQPAKK